MSSAPSRPAWAIGGPIELLLSSRVPRHPERSICLASGRNFKVIQAGASFDPSGRRYRELISADTGWLFARIDPDSGILWICHRVIRACGSYPDLDGSDGGQATSLDFAIEFNGGQYMSNSWMTFDTYMQSIRAQAPWLTRSEDDDSLWSDDLSHCCFEPDDQSMPSQAGIIAAWMARFA
ncbi:hypothetical protein UCRNP2_5164 [Neofusicoccum parvum UCRNP2]|uniref:Uncharacterized protein n=1 Tax=Botryosphaeria parva (strain UCR-NP2) TaxID=1287680 RepID=R1GIF4_BOTPV|nr:hypothetical protein UCRNP2_5164 [Neofusicoccum parvum UCRNP2]